METKLIVIREATPVEVPIEQMRELITNGETVWLDAFGKDAAEFANLVEPLGFHPLSLEDAMEAVLRPKVETFLNYVFVAVRAINHEAGARPHDTIGLKLFLGERFLVSVHRRNISSIGSVRDRLPQLLRRSTHPSIILAALCSDVIEYFDPVVRTLEDRIEEMEESSFQNPTVEAGEKLLAAQREVLLLRRAAVPVRDLLHTVIDRADPLITVESRVHLRDALDEITRITDWLNILRELSTGALTMYQAALDNQTNVAVKRLTTITLVFMFTGLLASLGGMTEFANLPRNWNFFAVSATIIAITAAALVITLRGGRK